MAHTKSSGLTIHPVNLPPDPDQDNWKQQHAELKELRHQIQLLTVENMKMKAILDRHRERVSELEGRI